MWAKLGIRLTALCAIVALAACGRLAGDDPKAPQLYSFKSQSRSPDEFTIAPTKPLQLPEDLANLPAPTPGGGNITDPTPNEDAVAALGGNPALLGTTQVPAGNGGLVSYASRYGTTENIRVVAAAEDLQYRRDNDGRLLERWFDLTIYFRAYEPMSLDQYGELERWRARGIRTVGAPPEAIAEGN